MSQRLLNFLYDPAWLLVCVLAGVGYSVFLYYKSPKRTPLVNVVLGTLRFILVAAIAMLLLNPRLVQQEVYEEKPSFSVLLDNSRSVLLHLDSSSINGLVTRLRDFQSTMATKGILVKVGSLTKHPFESEDTVTWIGFTDLDQPLRQLKESTTGTHFKGALLISDGVYNRGSAPYYRQYGFPIFTLGIGDTLPVPDVAIEDIQYNRTVYAGNDFEVTVYIKGLDLSSDVSIPVTLSDQNSLLRASDVKLFKGNSTAKLRFIVNSSEQGMRVLNLRAGKLPNEKRVENNQTSIYIDVVKNKERVLIAAAAPHPDLKALRLGLEQKQQLEVQLIIAGIHAWPEDIFDLIILHQLPNMKGSGTDWVTKAKKSNSALWVLTGSSTNYGALNELVLPGQIKLKSLSTDQAIAIPNSAFGAFQPDPIFMQRLKDFPPVTVPFGDYSVVPNALVLLQQKIGAISTTRPLLAVSTEYPKKAIWFGEGLWLWRLQEGMMHQESIGFDQWIGQFVQYLSAKQDKSKLRLFTNVREYLTGEDVTIQAETFDELLNPVYGKMIEVTLTKKGEPNGKRLTFENTMLSPGVTLKSLEPGLYTYIGQTTFNQKIETARGSFVIKDQAVEWGNPMPDHNTLRQLSSKTEGLYMHHAELEGMLSYLEKSLSSKPLLHSTLDEKSLFSLPWVLVVLLSLATVEWVGRKSTGHY